MHSICNAGSCLGFVIVKNVLQAYVSLIERIVYRKGADYTRDIVTQTLAGRARSTREGLPPVTMASVIRAHPRTSANDLQYILATGVEDKGTSCGGLGGGRREGNFAC